LLPSVHDMVATSPSVLSAPASRGIDRARDGTPSASADLAVPKARRLASTASSTTTSTSPNSNARTSSHAKQDTSDSDSKRTSRPSAAFTPSANASKNKAGSSDSPTAAAAAVPTSKADAVGNKQTDRNTSSTSHHSIGTGNAATGSQVMARKPAADVASPKAPLPVHTGSLMDFVLPKAASPSGRSAPASLVAATAMAGAAGAAAASAAPAAAPAPVRKKTPKAEAPVWKKL
jgi:hypothetical protein